MSPDDMPSPVMSRLKGLITAGYRIREQDFGDADNYFCLEHPAHRQKVEEKTLYLYDEGSVMGGPRIGGTCLLIKPDADTEFQRLIAATPKPTWWERNCAPFYALWAWIFIAAVTFAFVKLTELVWNALVGK